MGVKMALDYMSCNPEVLLEMYQKIIKIEKSIKDMVILSEKDILQFLKFDWKGIEKEVFRSEYIEYKAKLEPLLMLTDKMKLRLNNFAERVENTDNTYANKVNNI